MLHSTIFSKENVRELERYFISYMYKKDIQIVMGKYFWAIVFFIYIKIVCDNPDDVKQYFLLLFYSKTLLS